MQSPRHEITTSKKKNPFAKFVRNRNSCDTAIGLSKRSCPSNLRTIHRDSTISGLNKKILFICSLSGKWPITVVL